jgi:ataxia telangiectasia mutated family protein
MVGYIVGLGDRHTYNILVDMKTTELIPIDLGMCFEQGKLLSVPETVPFRLTRDIVDGMGLGGLDGVFSRCCCATVDVLRSNRDLLMAVMEVSFL